MRVSLIFFFMAFFLNGCAISAIVSEQAILFCTAPDLSAPKSIYKPYENINFTVEFICPGKCRSAMISPVIPLPPIVPVGSMGQRELYIKLSFPADEEIPLNSMQIELNNGNLVQLYGATEFFKTHSTTSDFYKILLLHIDCSELQGGEFQIEGFKYQGEMYPYRKTKLEFKSHLKLSCGYWGS